MVEASRLTAYFGMHFVLRRGGDEGFRLMKVGLNRSRRRHLGLIEPVQSRLLIMLQLKNNGTSKYGAHVKWKFTLLVKQGES